VSICCVFSVSSIFPRALKQLNSLYTDVCCRYGLLCAHRYFCLSYVATLYLFIQVSLLLYGNHRVNCEGELTVMT